MMKILLLIILSYICSIGTQAQTVVQPFALKDVKLLPSRFQRNMQRDSAWIASIPVNRLLHSFRNTSGIYSDLEAQTLTITNPTSEQRSELVAIDAVALGIEAGQVHPDDKLAMERHGCQGKTEMWYIIKSDVGSKIYAGLKKSITPDEYEQLANARDE